MQRPLVENVACSCPDSCATAHLSLTSISENPRRNTAALAPLPQCVAAGTREPEEDSLPPMVPEETVEKYYIVPIYSLSTRTAGS